MRGLALSVMKSWEAAQAAFALEDERLLYLYLVFYVFITSTFV